MKRCIITCVLLELVHAFKFVEVTDDIRLQDGVGQVAAYGDFNADKAIDILQLSENRSQKEHTLYLWSHSRHIFMGTQIILNVSDVVAAHTADFDGDGDLDILTVSEGTNTSCRTLAVHWCRFVHDQVTVESLTTLHSAVNFYPTVIDANGDHVADLLLSNCSNDMLVSVEFSSSRRGSTTTLGAPSAEKPPLSVSSYFVDLNSDCQSDLVISEDFNASTVVNVWLRDSQQGKFTLHQTVELSSVLGKAEVVGKLAFADMDGNGVLDAVVITCRNQTCIEPSIHILYQQKYPGINVFRCQTTSAWMLNVKVRSVPLLSAQVSPESIVKRAPSIGDIDLDGLPDVITTAVDLKQRHKGFQPLLLMGTHCKSKCNGIPVTLQPKWEPFEHLSNISRVSFFDLWENGILDILMTRSTENGNKILAYRQSLREDHAFLKVLVLSGHCFSDCKSGTKPYGSMLPGATVAFSTTDRRGKKKRAVGIVQRGSSLELPFLLFGLGETPNFIEHLTVGTSSNGEVTYHRWSLLIPNSQIIVIPRPPNDPDRWWIELYLTPSNLAYTTAAVLSGLFVVIASFVTVCHLRERYMDSKERRQSKHKFHFNAM